MEVAGLRGSRACPLSAAISQWECSGYRHKLPHLALGECWRWELRYSYLPSKCLPTRSAPQSLSFIFNGCTHYLLVSSQVPEVGPMICFSKCCPNTNVYSLKDWSVVTPGTGLCWTHLLPQQGSGFLLPHCTSQNWVCCFSLHCDLLCVMASTSAKWARGHFAHSVSWCSHLWCSFSSTLPWLSTLELL